MSTITETSTVFQIDRQIEYKENAIQKQIILKNTSGQIVLFAFDQGQELKTHTAPVDVLLHITEGQTRITIAEEQHHLKASEMIILPANIPHAVFATTAFKMVLTMIK